MPRGLLTLWSDEQDARLRSLWRAGCHVGEIAMVLRCSPRTAYRRAAALNLPRRSPGPAPAYSPEARQTLLDLAEVFSISTAAARVGVSRTTAWRWVMAERWGG